MAPLLGRSPAWNLGAQGLRVSSPHTEGGVCSHENISLKGFFSLFFLHCPALSPQLACVIQSRFFSYPASLCACGLLFTALDWLMGSQLPNPHASLQCLGGGEAKSLLPGAKRNNRRKSQREATDPHGAGHTEQPRRSIRASCAPARALLHTHT